MAKFKPIRSGQPTQGLKPSGGGAGLGGMMGGGGGNMNKMLSQMEKLQKEMEKTQGELATIEVTGSAGGGMVTVLANGALEVLSLTIKPEAVDPEDVELLQDMILAAVNDALNQARALEKDRMGALTGGLGIPGL